MSAVEITGLSKSFAGLHVVDNFSLRMREGEFVSILGPSGCGKSTILNIVAGFSEPSSGSVRVAGEAGFGQ